jgi:long-subunit fatty acid transport protein
MFSTPAVLIAAGRSDAGSTALEAAAAGLEAAAAAGVEAAAAGDDAAAADVDAAGAELAAVELFLLEEQPLRARTVAIARTPAAWVRGRRRSGVTGPPDTGRDSGDVRPGVARPHGT